MFVMMETKVIVVCQSREQLPVPQGQNEKE